MNERSKIGDDFTTRQYVELFGIQIDDLPLNHLLDAITNCVNDDQRMIVANVNIHAMNLVYDHLDFRNCINEADIVFCDGVGVMLGSRLTRQRLTHRYTPPDWIRKLCLRCVENEHSLFLLGARDGVAQQAASILLDEFPELKIAGIYHGFFNKRVGSSENQAIIQAINSVKPHILLVGFGMPLQELWLIENWDSINVNVALPVGALLDYVAGEVFRAPRWMTDNGLEWFGRLLIEPKRLWRRYLIGNPLFFWRVLKQRITGRSHHRM